MTQAQEAQPDEVEFTLVWQSVEDGLLGTLTAINVSDHPVRLSSKPEIVPLGVDGRAIGALTIMTLEFRAPGYAEVPPDGQASTTVRWGGWSGPAASGDVLVRWPGGEKAARTSGPAQPPDSGGGTNLSSGWFTLDLD